MGYDKCYDEYIEYDELVTGSYSTVPSPISVGSMHIKNPFGEIFFSDKDGKGSFAFTAPTAGMYSFCFRNLPTGGQKYVPALRTTYEIKIGVEAEDYNVIAIAEELTPLEVELRKLEDAAKAVNKHMSYMREREEMMRNTNESSNSRVFWLSLLSMTFLVSSGVWQIYYLKKYFRSE